MKLRQAIAKYMSERGDGGVAVDASEVVVGPGCKPGIFFTVLADCAPPSTRSTLTRHDGSWHKCPTGRPRLIIV